MHHAGVLGFTRAIPRGSFCMLRFLLGVAEAGLVPGVILYLAGWIPSVRRARVIAMFYLAVPLSTVLGAPCPVG